MNDTWVYKDQNTLVKSVTAVKCEHIFSVSFYFLWKQNFEYFGLVRAWKLHHNGSFIDGKLVACGSKTEIFVTHAKKGVFMFYGTCSHVRPKNDLKISWCDAKKRRGGGEWKTEINSISVLFLLFI